MFSSSSPADAYWLPIPGLVFQIFLLCIFFIAILLKPKERKPSFFASAPGKYSPAGVFAATSVDTCGLIDQSSESWGVCLLSFSGFILYFPYPRMGGDVRDHLNNPQHH